MSSDSQPKVSAIVSTYNSERFIRGALEDLVNQTLFAQEKLEIIVIDSGSQQDEGRIVREFQNTYPSIRYLRTQRETIYGAWNQGVRLARGEYLTNANADDRHRSDALQRMAEVLDQDPSVGLVYADALITTVANETFAANTADRFFRWPEYSLRQLLMHSIFGPQPMWRHSLHDAVGDFDSELMIAGDYEFFIRAAWRGGARHIPEILGLYLEGGLESRHLQRCREETDRVLHRYRSMIPIEDIYPEVRNAPDPRTARAIALWDFAHWITVGPHPDPVLCERMHDQALMSLARAPLRDCVKAGGRLLAARLAGTKRWHPVVTPLPPIATEIVMNRS